ncbi:MAG: hypothetical protein J6Q14_08455 [Oscillospiraceae bacterium]|nr:hypothetical protein [Oscillospiraceae bacterium]
MNIKHNVVERLYVVHAKIGDGKYQFRVQAESDEMAKTKAERAMKLRFNGEKKYEVIDVEKIEPDDFV